MLSSQRYIDTNGIIYKIERNGSVISELKGTQNREPSTSKRFAGFKPGSDVRPGDWLINPANERLFVYDTLTSFLGNKIDQLKAYYQTTYEHNSKEKSTISYSVGTANNSVIGTQAAVTMNINSSLQEVKEQVSSSNSDDKEELLQIISTLEMIVNDQIPAQKGLLAKFSDTIQKNSWIASPISSIILNWLVTQFH